MAQRISYGVLIQNEYDQVLLAHVTGCHQWDLPKGGGDPGELPLAAALRETWEETGIALDPATLEDLGCVPYRTNKALHLFRVRVSTRDVDINACVCTSHFQHRVTGVDTPEMDGFRWAHLHEVKGLCVPPMAAVITQYALSTPEALAA